MAKKRTGKAAEPNNHTTFLTAAEKKMARYRITDGLTLANSYHKAHPKSKASKDTMRIEGSTMMRRIKNKLGSWRDVFETFDAGPEALIKVFVDGMHATVYTDVYEKTKSGKGEKAETQRVTILAEDHGTRIRAARELKDIFGLTEQTLNIKTDQPLGIVYVYEGTDKDPEG